MNNWLINFLIVLGTFIAMEGVAWFTHKYVMHGLLWILHRDHHQKDHDSFLERNDSFFLIFAIPGIVCLALGSFYGNDTASELPSTERHISLSMIYSSTSGSKSSEMQITGTSRRSEEPIKCTTSM